MSRPHAKKRAARARRERRLRALWNSRTTEAWRASTFVAGGGYISALDDPAGVGVALVVLDPMRGEVRR